MTTSARARPRARALDLPLVMFFVLAAGIAWFAFAAVGWLTGASNVLETQEVGRARSREAWGRTAPRSLRGRSTCSRGQATSPSPSPEWS